MSNLNSEIDLHFSEVRLIRVNCRVVDDEAPKKAGQLQKYCVASNKTNRRCIEGIAGIPVFLGVGFWNKLVVSSITLFDPIICQGTQSSKLV